MRGDIRRVGDQDIPFITPTFFDAIEPFIVKDICLLERYLRGCGGVESPATDVMLEILAREGDGVGGDVDAVDVGVRD